MPKPHESGVKSVHFALDVLEAVASEPGDVGVSELAVKLGTTKATVFRHLKTLVERNYLAHSSATQRYRIGVRSHLLGQSAAGRIGIISSSQSEIADLRNETGETVVLSRISHDGAMVLATHLGKSNLEIGVRPGSTLDLHATAQGKIALAFGDPSLLRKYSEATLSKLTPLTITDAETLQSEVAKVRMQGNALAPEQTILGVNAIAAPIIDGTGATVGAIAIVGSIQKIEAIPEPALVYAVLRCAQRISWNLGYTGLMPFNISPLEVEPA